MKEASITYPRVFQISFFLNFAPLQFVSFLLQGFKVSHQSFPGFSYKENRIKLYSRFEPRIPTKLVFIECFHYPLLVEKTGFALLNYMVAI